MPKKKYKKSSHKKFSPSKSNRWLNCPGSVQLSEQVPPPPTSVHAAEGTAAHKLAELCLEEDCTPDIYHGHIINDFVVDDEMVEAVELYLNVLAEDWEKAKPGSRFHIEHKVNMDHIHPDLGGTCDAIIDQPKKKLTDYDLKYGKGIDVDAEKNTQGMNYILGYSDKPYKEYEIVIVQPRLEDKERRVKRWTFKRGELNKFHKRVMQAIQKAGYEDPEYNAGDWCRFCPAAGICPILHNKALEVAQADFTPVASSIDLTAPIDLTPDQLILVLDNSKLIESWLKSVEAHALGLLSRGEEVPGYKLVRGRSNRIWREDIDVVKKLKKLKLKEDDIFEEKMKTPAKIEKILGGKAGREAIENLWTKGEGKITIAPESDKRPESPPPAQLDFDTYDD